MRNKLCVFISTICIFQNVVGMKTSIRYDGYKVSKENTIMQTIETLKAKGGSLHASEYFDELLKTDFAKKIRDLRISGNDLITLGFKGKEIGTVLEELFGIVTEEPSLNTKEQLTEIIKSKDFLKRYGKNN